MAIQLNLSDRDERTLNRIVEELNYQDPTDLIEHFISEYREQRFSEKLASIGQRMFPNGIARPEEEDPEDDAQHRRGAEDA